MPSEEVEAVKGQLNGESSTGSEVDYDELADTIAEKLQAGRGNTGQQSTDAPTSKTTVRPAPVG